MELSNRGWLVPEYFDMLRSHNVAHVFNNWTRMPSALEQLALEGSDTADFMVARMLLKPGRGYKEVVTKFPPYKEIQEINEEARRASIGASSMEIPPVQNVFQRASIWERISPVNMGRAEPSRRSEGARK